MARRKSGKPGPGRSKPQAEKGTAQEAIQFASNPKGYAAKKVVGEVKKRLGKAGGGMAKKRMTYNKGGYASVYDMESDCKRKAGYNTMKIEGEK